MIPRTFHDGKLNPDSELDLSKQASHHLAKVLRVREGDHIKLFNGDGSEYSAVLTAVSNRRCSVHITTVSVCDNESPLHITLLQGLSRNDRMDTTLQKVTELGVGQITPVICKRSRFRLDEDRLEKKLAHWKQIIISACEQSGRCIVPQITAPVSLEQAVADQRTADCRIILSPDASTKINELVSLDEHVSILIGPESGLDEDEVALAQQHDFTAISLGPRILRTETAGPATIAALQTLWGDFS